jgi:hypothetical protein
VFKNIMSERNIFEVEFPFTRFEKPEGVEIESVHGTDMIYSKDLRTARKLRTELIKSVELLDFYIYQMEEIGKIQHYR